MAATAAATATVGGAARRGSRWVSEPPPSRKAKFLSRSVTIHMAPPAGGFELKLCLLRHRACRRRRPPLTAAAAARRRSRL